MKVVINAASTKMGGALRYITDLLHHLPPPASGLEFLVWLPPATLARQPAFPKNIRALVTGAGQAKWYRRLWWEQVTLRRFLKREKVDVLFSSANFGMMRCPVWQLLLIQNALYFSKIYQEMFLAKHRLRARAAFRLRCWLIRQSVRSADVVMTPTQATLDVLRNFVEVPAGKAFVNPYGVFPADPHPEPHPDGAGRPAGQCETEADRTVRLVYVSLYSEHKNLSTLLQALPLLNQDGGCRFVLRTTADPDWDGAAGTFNQKNDLALARRREVAQSVESVGPLDWRQTQDLYRNADVFVFPSLIESFGYPMAEAMAYGLPIVAADTPVNREICGEAAVYFSPLSPQDLARQVRRVAAEASLRSRMRATACRRAAARFRWSEHVSRLLAVAAGQEPGLLEPHRVDRWSENGAPAAAAHGSGL